MCVAEQNAYPQKQYRTPAKQRGGERSPGERREGTAWEERHSRRPQHSLFLAAERDPVADSRTRVLRGKCSASNYAAHGETEPWCAFEFQRGEVGEGQPEKVDPRRVKRRANLLGGGDLRRASLLFARHRDMAVEFEPRACHRDKSGQARATDDLATEWAV